MSWPGFCEYLTYRFRSHFRLTHTDPNQGSNFSQTCRFRFRSPVGQPTFIFSFKPYSSTIGLYRVCFFYWGILSWSCHFSLHEWEDKDDLVLFSEIGIFVDTEVGTASVEEVEGFQMIACEVRGLVNFPFRCLVVFLWHGDWERRSREVGRRIWQRWFSVFLLGRMDSDFLGHSRGDGLFL